MIDEIIEIESEGVWPEYSITDVNNARIRLQNSGWVKHDFYLIGSYKIMKYLDNHLPDESKTYRAFFLNNNLIARVIEEKEDNSFVTVISYNTDFERGDVFVNRTMIKINNVKCKQPTPLSDLTDAELLDRINQPYAQIGIIREATKRAFQSLKGKVNEEC